ncbi:MAG: antibiotic transport system permease protein [archaeon GW2011_AR3]|nr:MAG: antibiotic transport system permease protein [archaeon GW2011_AR3]MBS3109962.1 ABC transporter permease [Candidatus Woesearchaeota archaeon]
MKRIGLIMKKNLTIMLKSRWWAIVFILLPLLIIFLAGIAFDNLSEYKIKVSIYSGGYSSLTNSFIAKLNADPLQTVKASSEASCIDNVKIGLAHTCVIFPPGMEIGGANNEISIFIDYSNLNLAWVVRDRLYSKLEERSKEISAGITNDLLGKASFINDEMAKDLAYLETLEGSNAEIITRSGEAKEILDSLNRSIRLNSSDIDSVDSKIRSVKSTVDSAMADSKDVLDFADLLVRSGDFSESDENKHFQTYRNYQKIILGHENYINNLFSSSYAGTINNSLMALRVKVENLNSNYATVEQQLSGSSDQYAAISGLASTGGKVAKRLKTSLADIQKRLSSIGDVEAEQLASPATANIKALSTYNSNLDFVFPTLMAISIMFAGIFLAAIVFVVEHNSPAQFRNSVSPTHKIVFFIADFLTNLSLVSVQIIIMLSIAFAFFFNTIVTNLWTTLAICILVAAFFVLFGALIGVIFRSESITILASALISSSLLLFSNLLIPIENIPSDILRIIQFNPFILSVSLLRKAIIFSQPLPVLKDELLTLMLLAEIVLALYIIIYWATNRTRFTSQRN